jgi:hypothetical protein
LAVVGVSSNPAFIPFSFFPFGIYEALPVLAEKAVGMEPISNDSKMALSSLPILASGANYNEYDTI